MNNITSETLREIPENPETLTQFKTIGTMKNHLTATDGIKDFYTPQEARRFTRADLDRNPALLQAVEASMVLWK